MITEIKTLIERVKETQDVNLLKEHAEEIINIYLLIILLLVQKQVQT